MQAWGFTDRMPVLFAAADALIHSTAGLTMLEALMRGLPAISYGWGVGHIRLNNEAYARFGLADVATDRARAGDRAATARWLERPEPDLVASRRYRPPPRSSSAASPTSVLDGA